MFSFVKKNNKQKGFSLVEMLMAIFLFSIAIAMVMTILSQGISGVSSVKRKLTATLLAQEGIEYIRNLRDTYVIYGNSEDNWKKFKEILDASCQDACFFIDEKVFESGSMLNLEINACGGLCLNLLYDKNNGKYGYSNGEDSGFSRSIKIIPLNENEVKIISKVSWQQGLGNTSVSLSENLLNWVES